MSEVKKIVVNEFLAVVLGDFTGSVHLKIADGKVSYSVASTSGSFEAVQAQVDVKGTLVDVAEGEFDVAMEAGAITKMTPAKPGTVPKPAASPKASSSRTSGSNHVSKANAFA